MTRQLSLLAGADSSAEGTRIDLGCGAWVDHEPHWFSEPEFLFDRLTDDLDWQTASRLPGMPIVSSDLAIASLRSSRWDSHVRS